jgi:hypothetical protein
MVYSGFDLAEHCPKSLAGTIAILG